LEEKEVIASAIPDPGDDFTETKYLIYGLDLEERQLVICRRDPCSPD